MKFERRFTTVEGGAYEGISFEKRTSALRNADGSSAGNALEVSVPRNGAR